MRIRATLHLAREGGRLPVPLDFVIDSGASYSLISLEMAQSRRVETYLLGPEIILQPTTAQGATPMRVRPGRVRAWWNNQLRGYPFDWPVLFRIGGPLGVPAILGLGGVVNTCRWEFDGGYSPDSPHGFLTLEDIR